MSHPVWIKCRPMLDCRVLLAAIALTSGTAAAQSLTMGVGSPASSLDPHYHQLRSNSEVSKMLFDTLINSDTKARMHPGLAESWKPIGEHGWELRLREGVRFQDGTPFTADDVAFTVARIPQVTGPGASYSAHVRPVRSVEVVDPRTVRMMTDGPFPLLPVYFSQVFMLSRKIHSGATTADFNSGKVAIGTGPFRLASYRPNDRIVLTRNDNYWGGAPHWSEVNYRIITNNAARMAALLAGDVDFIDQIPTGDVARLRADQRFTVAEATSLRSMYLTLDSTREPPVPGMSDAEGKPLARNPLADPRVRRALSLAIDREALVERVLQGAGVASGQFIPEGAYSYLPDLPVPTVDPETAKRLLGEAGYPDGFRMILAGSNDRYINDARVVQAVGQMWTRIGVRITVEAQPYATFIGRATRREMPAALLSWGNSTGEASVLLKSVLSTVTPAEGRGVANRIHYSNPTLDRKLAAAEVEMDDTRREGLLQEAQRVAIEDLAVVPLYIQKALWAMRAGLTYEPRVDERNDPTTVRPVR